MTPASGAVTRARLSVVVITLDEEERIRECLDSVAWADELIVIDAESRDKTVAIARELTEHVSVRPWPGFAAQKNFGLAQASGDWILSLDADETVSPALRAEIVAVLASGGAADGYAVPRRTTYMPRKRPSGRNRRADTPARRPCATASSAASVA